MSDFEEKTFIQLHRRLLNWEWFQDSKVLHVFIYLLLKANHKPEMWQGWQLEPGQRVTSYEKIAESTGLSIQNVRTAIKKLKSTCELTCKSTNKFTLITITNWELYQLTNKKLTYKSTCNLTNNQQTTNKQLTTNNKDNKDNKEYIEEEESADEILKNWYGSEYKNVHLTDTEYQKLLALTMSEKALNLIIEDFSQRIAERKEENWTPESPQIHYARLKKYWEYRRKHPEKFKNTAAEPQVPFYSPEIED